MGEPWDYETYCDDKTSVISWERACNIIKI